MTAFQFSFQFQHYFQVRLGDKTHEKVFDSIAQVNKAMRVAAPGTEGSRSRRLKRGDNVKIVLTPKMKFKTYQN